MANRSDTSHSFVDLMTSLAVIFILIAVIFMDQLSREKKKTLANVQNLRSELKAALKKINDEQKLGLQLTDDSSDPRSVKIEIEDNVTGFAHDRDDLPDEAKRNRIKTIFVDIRAVLCQRDMASNVERISIEGHTDQTGEQSEAGFEHNLRLSQARAFTVARLAVNQDDHIAAENWINDTCFRQKLSVSGFGSSQPIDTTGDKRNTDDDRHAANRRVVIKVRATDGTEDAEKDDKVAGGPKPQ